MLQHEFKIGGIIWVLGCRWLREWADRIMSKASLGAVMNGQETDSLEM